jgi:hypothetical protein
MSSDHPEQDQQECAVCTESITLPLLCGHYIHPTCVAKSGQNQCSICRTELVFAEQDQQTYLTHKTQNDLAKIQQEQAESITLARRLENENPPEIIRIRINSRTYHITLEEDTDAPILAADMMLQVNAIMHNIQNRQMHFRTSEPALELYRIIMDLNRVSATSGLSIPQIWEVVENNTT